MDFLYGYNPAKQWFKRDMCCLTAVPHDIPAAAVQVFLQDNRITSLLAGVFQHLSHCLKLYLDHNHISSLHKHSFLGLNKLENLYLHDNPISSISEGSFNSLYFLKFLWLSNTKLITLNPNLLVNLPRPLNLGFSSPENQWNCSSLCWLKHEEQHGTVDLGYVEVSLSCAQDQDWNSLQCGHPGLCICGDSPRSIPLYHQSLLA